MKRRENESRESSLVDAEMNECWIYKYILCNAHSILLFVIKRVSVNIEVL